MCDWCGFYFLSLRLQAIVYVVFTCVCLCGACGEQIRLCVIEESPQSHTHSVNPLSDNSKPQPWLTMLLFSLLLLMGSLFFRDPHLWTTFFQEWESISLCPCRPSLSVFDHFPLVFFQLELEQASCLTIGGTRQSEVSHLLISPCLWGTEDTRSHILTQEERWGNSAGRRFFLFRSSGMMMVSTPHLAFYFSCD